MKRLLRWLLPAVPGGLRVPFLLFAGDRRPARADGRGAAGRVLARRPGDDAGAARPAGSGAAHPRLRLAAPGAAATTAATPPTPTSAGPTWCGTCTPRRASRSSRSRNAFPSPAASATAASSRRKRRASRPRACAARATTSTSAACPRTRRSAGSTTRCSPPSSATPTCSSRGSCSTSSRTSASTLKGDTTFNESFAVTVEEEGVRRWLEAEGRGSELAAFRSARLRRREFAARVAQTRERLAKVYQERISPKRRCWRASARNATGCAPTTRRPCRPSRTTPILVSIALYTRAGARVRASARRLRRRPGRVLRRVEGACGRASPARGRRSRQRDVDDLPERRALRTGARTRPRRSASVGPLDRHAHPALHLAADRDVAHGEGAAGDVGFVLQIRSRALPAASRICSRLPRSPSGRASPAACGSGPRTPRAWRSGR